MVYAINSSHEKTNLAFFLPVRRKQPHFSVGISKKNFIISNFSENLFYHGVLLSLPILYKNFK